MLQEITLIVLIGGLAATIYQLQQVVKGQRLHSFNMLLDIWGKNEEREARRYVIKEYSPKSKLSNGDRQKVETVLAVFNRIGFAVSKKLVPKKRCYGTLWIFRKALLGQA